MSHPKILPFFSRLHRPNVVGRSAKPPRSAARSTSLANHAQWGTRLGASMNLRTLSDPSVASDSEGMYQSSRALPKMRILALFPSLTEDWAILDRLAGETNLSILVDHTVNPLFSTTAGYRLTRSDGADLTAAFGGELQYRSP